MSLTLTLIATASLSLAAQDHQHGDDHQHHHDHDHTAEHHEPAKDTAVTSEDFGGRNITVAVNGMVCDFCAQSLMKVLERNEAVETVDISLEDKTIAIVLKEGGSMSDEELDKAVKSAGYNIASIDRASS